MKDTQRGIDSPSSLAISLYGFLPFSNFFFLVLSHPFHSTPQHPTPQHCIFFCLWAAHFIFLLLMFFSTRVPDRILLLSSFVHVKPVGHPTEPFPFISGKLVSPLIPEEIWPLWIRVGASSAVPVRYAIPFKAKQILPWSDEPRVQAVDIDQ